jgi:hypothetical protein
MAIDDFVNDIRYDLKRVLTGFSAEGHNEAVDHLVR